MLELSAITMPPPSPTELILFFTILLVILGLLFMHTKPPELPFCIVKPVIKVVESIIPPRLSENKITAPNESPSTMH